MKIVLVEDNAQLASTIAHGLSEDGIAVEVVGTAGDAIARGQRRDLDVMVLDLGLPDIDEKKVKAAITRAQKRAIRGATTEVGAVRVVPVVDPKKLPRQPAE